jgi:hypothetical protein
MWAWDGGKRREPVLDLDRFPARVVRSVGWNTCLRCAQPFFSEDVVGIRMCESCKTPALARDWSKRKIAAAPQVEATSRSDARTMRSPRAEDKATVPR